MVEGIRRIFVNWIKANQTHLLYIINDHLGTPREMFTEDGKIVWAASYSTWGKIRGLKGPRPPDNDNFGIQQKEYDRDEHGTLTLRPSGNLALQSVPEIDHEFEQVALQCPLRFQGQYEDQESSLYYNRFRYYDPISTQYISPDPIGLGGGTRQQAYVTNPNRWTDPWGLNGIPELPPTTIYNNNGLKIWQNYGNLGGGNGVPIEHAPIHFHVEYDGNEYRFLPGGDQMPGDKYDAPRRLKDLMQARKTDMRKAEDKIGRWYKYHCCGGGK